MNPDFRRVALIAAALGLLVSLFVALRSGDDDEGAASATTATTATTSAAATTSATATTEPMTTERPPGPVLELRLREGLPVGGIQRWKVERGRVSIRVTSDTAGELHVHGYDLTFPIEQSGTQELAFEADAPGIFEIELEGTHATLAELEVRP